MKKNYLNIEKPSGNTFDWNIFIPTFLLSIIGIFSIYSATRGVAQDSFVIRQLTAMGIGIAAMIGAYYLPKKVLETFWISLYILSSLLLVYVLLFGEVVYGTKGWIRFGGLSLQPAEFTKLAVIVSLAGFISRKGVFIGNIRDIFISAILVFIQFLLIYLQPDHGTASVLIVILIGILFWSGFSSLLVFVMIAFPILVLLSFKGTLFYIIGASIFSIAVFFFRKNILVKILVVITFASIGLLTPIIENQLQSHQRQRIESFINPTSDPLGSGYNVLQSVMAVGSGGIIGKGFLQGSQTQLRYIPMQWTDFIFSVPSEEFGLIGAIVVIGLYFWLINRIIKIANLTDNKFYSLVCFGIATVLIYHITINIGMVIGLVPVMGLPLPFMSYGGTAMIVNYIFIGLVLHTYRLMQLKRKEL